MRIKLVVFLLAAFVISATAWLVDAQPREGEVPEKYRDTVAKGLAYLVKQQHADGHWEGDDGKNPVAVTALAGMALLMEGSGPERGAYKASVRKTIDWLLSKSQAGREGLIYSGHASETGRYMQGHALATQFLAWCYQLELDDDRRKKMQVALESAVKYIARAQSTQGGWYDTSRAEGHDFASIPATTLQLQALYTVGLAAPRIETIAASGQEYLKTAVARYDGKTKPAGNRAADTVLALVCRSCPVAYLDQDGVSSAWFTYCKTAVPMGEKFQFGRDELMHLYYAQALYTLSLNQQANARNSAMPWSEYRPVMFDHLKRTQNKDGSWPGATEQHASISVGPVASTALWCIVLQLDKSKHPLTQQRILNTF